MAKKQYWEDCVDYLLIMHSKKHLAHVSSEVTIVALKKSLKFRIQVTFIIKKNLFKLTLQYRLLNFLYSSGNINIVLCLKGKRLM